MSLWAISVYCVLVLIYTVPAALFVRRRAKIKRLALTKRDQSVPDELVGTLPVDRW
jgi:hypothetical protein